jgi:hypothetical protein
LTESYRDTSIRDPNHRPFLNVNEKSKYIDRWISVGAPLLGAGNALPYLMLGTDTPMKFKSLRNIMEAPGLWDLIPKPFQ